MNKQTGRCLCGSIQFETSAKPVMSVNCHCTHCQKATGTAFSANIVIPEGAFKIEGNTLKAYTDTGDSGQQLQRYFCSECGSPIYTQVDVMPGVVVVKVGALDDTSTYEPSVNIWCESQMNWIKQNKEIPNVAQMPSE